MGEPPTIETDRLVLRARTMADFAPFAAALADPAVVARLGFGPLSRDQAWMRFARGAGMWALLGYGPFIVEDRASGAYAGEVGPGDFKREGEPAPATPEFSWLVAPAFQGRGIAREALAAAIAWTENRFPTREFGCCVETANAPSTRLAHRFGFAPVGRVKLQDATLVVMRRPAARAA
ncbi:MAG: GNAT family N-acetyltransferase [Parvularculaceae bacterium]